MQLDTCESATTKFNLAAEAVSKTCRRRTLAPQVLWEEGCRKSLRGKTRMHLGFRVRALTLATAGVVLTAAACGPSSGGGGAAMASPDKQVLRVNLRTEPSTLDPTQQQWVYEASIGRIQYEALVRAKGDLSDVEGAAASSWDISSDGLTWTFHIRSDEKYSDGNPVV